MVNRLPLAGGASMVIFEFDSPRALDPALQRSTCASRPPDYFKAMGIPRLEGARLRRSRHGDVDAGGSHR